MKKSSPFVLIALLTLGLLSTAALRAEDVRFPKDKDPAYTLTLPDKWVATPDDSGNLIVKSANQACDLSLSLINDAEAAKMTPDELHTIIMKEAKVDDLNKKEDAQVDGHKGTAYYGEVKIPNGAVSIKLIIMKLDDAHVASVTVVTTTIMTDDDKAGLAKLLASMKIVGLK